MTASHKEGLVPMGNKECIKAAAGKSRGHWVPVLAGSEMFVRGSRKRYAVIEKTESGNWIGIVWDSGMPDAVFEEGPMDDIAAKCAYTMGLDHEGVPNV
jgi:hypothetical protein